MWVGGGEGDAVGVQGWVVEEWADGEDSAAAVAAGESVASFGGGEQGADEEVPAKVLGAFGEDVDLTGVAVEVGGDFEDYFGGEAEKGIWVGDFRDGSFGDCIFW